MNLKKAKKIYFIGIEGAGTSALAVLLKNKGKEISGSDQGDHFYYDNLKKAGITVCHKFDKENISDDVDLIIYSTAYNTNNNPELSFARQKKITIIKYPEAMAEVFNEKFGIAVCGTHGKTTTSAFLAYILKKSGYSPSAIIGSTVPQFNGGSLVGNSDIFVIEADEYQNKLQLYNPKAVLLNNIDFDHPDFFNNQDEYLQVFLNFIKKIPKRGFLVANFDHPVVKKIASVNCRAKVVSYAINETADYVAYDIKNFNKKLYFKVKLGLNENTKNNATDLGRFVISLPGKHNISNALAVIAAAIELSVPLNLIREHLEAFTGTARRLQELGRFKGALIIDDYAHHPVEIRAGIEALKQKYQKIDYLVFHPHTFTRTKAFLADFAASFVGIEHLLILDIYGSAREKSGTVHSRDLIKKINELPKTKKPKSVIYTPDLKSAKDYLLKNIKANDIVVLMGAGDVHFIGHELLK